MPRPPRKSRAKSSRPARSAASNKGPGVVTLLDDLKHPQRKLIDALRTLIARAVPTATEAVKWNAPSFATTEHFATFHLRARQGVQLILHLGAKPRAGVDMRKVIKDPEEVLEWKGPDRAIITVRDPAHLAALTKALTLILKAWVRQGV